ncbi:MAG: hypothetical protein ABIH34_08510 [Nanoarchaeota archaeon]
MTDIPLLIQQTRELLTKFDPLKDAIKRDQVLRELFPMMYEMIEKDMQHLPTILPNQNERGGSTDVLNDKNYVNDLKNYFTKLLKDLKTEVKIEGHDHHGLYQVMHNIFEKLEELSKSL